VPPDAVSVLAARPVQTPGGPAYPRPGAPLPRRHSDALSPRPPACDLRRLNPAAAGIRAAT